MNGNNQRGWASRNTTEFMKKTSEVVFDVIENPWLGMDANEIAISAGNCIQDALHDLRPAAMALYDSQKSHNGYIKILEKKSQKYDEMRRNWVSAGEKADVQRDIDIVRTFIDTTDKANDRIYREIRSMHMFSPGAPAERYRFFFYLINDLIKYESIIGIRPDVDKDEDIASELGALLASHADAFNPEISSRVFALRSDVDLLDLLELLKRQICRLV